MEKAMELLGRLAQDLVIGDGGVGALLQRRGLKAGECGDLWDITHPAEVEAVHRLFVEAGSELIQANTFQSNSISLRRHGLSDRVAELNCAGVAVARRAAGDRVFVVGSMGPTAELLEPYGSLTPAEAAAAFAEQAQALASAGADGLIVETFTAVEEAELAVTAAKATGLPVIATLSFQANGATVMGVKPAQAIERLTAAGADVVGANCGIGPEELYPIMAQFRELTDGYLIAQPNAGMPQLVDGETVFPAAPGLMADYAVKFRELGIKLIGGCCGTRPEHIAAMAGKLRS